MKTGNRNPFCELLPFQSRGQNVNILCASTEKVLIGEDVKEIWVELKIWDISSVAFPLVLGSAKAASSVLIRPIFFQFFNGDTVPTVS